MRISLGASSYFCSRPRCCCCFFSSWKPSAAQRGETGPGKTRNANLPIVANRAYHCLFNFPLSQPRLFFAWHAAARIVLPARANIMEYFSAASSASFPGNCRGYREKGGAIEIALARPLLPARRENFTSRTMRSTMLRAAFILFTFAAAARAARQE